MDEFRHTHFNLPKDVIKYKGKVRDVFIRDDVFVSVATDRISAFDHILPRTILYKGQVLNQTASFFLQSVKDIIPTWLIDTPDPNVSVGKRCEPIRIEMVIRGYLTGHAWREYKSGKRQLCGVAMPDNMKENDPFEKPIITPSTKAMEGHDVDISKDEIIEGGYVEPALYAQMEVKAKELFARGQQMAKERGLILVDTKYEFGLRENVLTLMDEIHTPDSSRYFYLDSYHENQSKGLQQNQLSKEFVREWLISKGFQGRPGDIMPVMDDEMAHTVSERYIQLYEIITGERFVRHSYNQIESRIENVLNSIFEK